MVRPNEDRILYDDQDDGGVVVRPRSFAALGTALIVVAVIAYFGLGSSDPEPLGVTQSLETLKPVPALASGFDASSNDFEACDATREGDPDFSIVVAGNVPTDGHVVVSRVVQFVVVDSYLDYRYGRDVRTQSLCTLE
jgi:hypothetical protein